jgi:tetratricopeptide (TPR) repeat protein
MTVVDLHPEDLLDRDASGELTALERARLEQHVARCASCRVERQLRADFRDEDGPGDVDVQRLLAGVLAPGAELTAPDAPRPAVAKRGVSRLRLRPLLLAAALLLVTGVAGATGWTGLRRLVVGSPSSIVGVRVDGADETAARPAGPKAQRPSPASVAPPASAPLESEPRPSAAIPVVTAAVPRATLPADRRPELVPAVPAAPKSDAVLLFDRANAAQRRGDRDRAAELYRALIEEYPASPEAHQSQAALGRVLLANGDVLAALRSFDGYLRVGGPLEEDVLADRATALGKLGRTSDEISAWSSLLRSFPTSVHAAHARARIEELGER